MIYCCTKTQENLMLSHLLSQNSDNIFVTHLFKLSLISCRLLTKHYVYGSLVWGPTIKPQFNTIIGV